MKTLAKLSFAVLAIGLTAFSAQAQSNSYKWGVGLRAGEPSGITVKKYNGSNAWELNIGRARYWTYAYDYGYYFNHDNRYKGYKYLGYRGHTGLDVQLRKLWSKNLPDVNNLNWYYGIGGQLFTNSYYYKYRDENDIVREDRYTNFDVGIDGILGLEYFFDELPISVSLDVNATMLLIDRPLYLFGQSGLGIRYNF